MPSEFSVRSDSVDVEQIMGRIRARIREKRGVDYTEDEIRELANVKIEQFLDPTRVRSELLDLYLKGRSALEPSTGTPGEVVRESLYRRLRGFPRKAARGVKRRLRKLLVNENIERLNYALFHNLVVELTRVSIEVKNLKMRVESLSSRLDFNERRARAMEHVVQYKGGSGPAAEPSRPAAAPAGNAGQRRELEYGEGPPKGDAQRKRRRRRRGRGGPNANQIPADGAGQASTDQSHDADAGGEAAHPSGGHHAEPGGDHHAQSGGDQSDQRSSSADSSYDPAPDRDPTAQ